MHAGHMRCQFPSSPTTPERVCRLSTDFRGALREIRRKGRRSLFHFAKPTPQRPVRQAFRNSPGIAVSIAEGVDWDPVALTDGKQRAASFQSAALRLKERRSLVRRSQKWRIETAPSLRSDSKFLEFSEPPLGTLGRGRTAFLQSVRGDSFHCESLAALATGWRSVFRYVSTS